MITDIEKLKGEIAQKSETFNSMGGVKTYKEIKSQMAERDRMLDYIEQTEKGGNIPSHQSLMDNTVSPTLDPAVQQELQTKKQYVEKLRKQIKEMRQENELLAAQHYQM